MDETLIRVSVKYVLVPLSDPIALFFAGLMLVLWSKSVFQFLRKRDDISAFDRYLPTALPMVGVVGTFTGIYVGLVDFDVSKIDDSIEALLKGLKIAFTSSIVGMALSLILRAIYSIGTSAPSEDVSAVDIHRILTSLDSHAEDGEAQNIELLGGIRNAISSDADSSVVGQIMRLRADGVENVRDLRQQLTAGFGEMTSEFRKFSENVSEDGSKALVDALNNLIGDFNHNLTSQFGDNFKQLNTAVGALLVWQDNYRSQIETISAEFRAAKEGIAEVHTAIQAIGENARSIPETMTALGGVIEQTDDRIASLAAHLEALAGLRERAENAFPIIEENLVKLTEGFAASVGDSSNSVKAAVDEQQKALVEVLAGMHVTFEQILSESSTALNQSFKTFDGDMQTEIKRVIELMGSHLASLSEKFVKDYDPLVSELRRIVELAASARPST